MSLVDLPLPHCHCHHHCLTIDSNVLAWFLPQFMLVPKPDVNVSASLRTIKIFSMYPGMVARQRSMARLKGRTSNRCCCFEGVGPSQCYF